MNTENKNNPFLTIYLGDKDSGSLDKAFNISKERVKELTAHIAPISFDVLTGKKQYFEAMVECTTIAETATELASIICLFNQAMPRIGGPDITKLLEAFLKTKGL